MANDKTAGEFHSAKSDLEGALINFKNAAGYDDRDLKEELLEALGNCFDPKFVETLNN